MAQMVKQLPAITGDLGSIPQVREDLLKGNAPTGGSCLGEFMDGGTWWEAVVLWGRKTEGED